MNRAEDWLKQAREDLLWARDTYKTGRYSHVCFICQQTAEKALKAAALASGFVQIRSHSLLDIAKAMKINGEIERMAKRLDLYYISARYPDAFPAGAPFEFFTEDQAEEAVRFAEAFLRYAEAVVDDA